jgi:hypothetical protein
VAITLAGVALRVVDTGNSAVVERQTIPVATQVLFPAIAQYGVPPGIQAFLFTQLPGALQGEYQRFLNQVIRDHGVAAPGQCHCVQPIPVVGDALAQSPAAEKPMCDVHIRQMFQTGQFIHSACAADRVRGVTGE